MQRIKSGHVVEDKQTGRKGVTWDDKYDVCADWETPVFWDGEQSFLGTNTETLKDLGLEQAIPDMKKCGAGLGVSCCIFLVVGSDGPECQRFKSMRFALEYKRDTMTAKRRPVAMYPDCMMTDAEINRLGHERT